MAVRGRVYGHLQRGRRGIMLSTDDFTNEDVDMLVEKLSELGFICHRVNVPGPRIHISALSKLEFLNFIEDSPVRCYDYKWSGVGISQ